MGFLDDFAGDVLSNLFTGGRTDKKLSRLMEEGELVPATIDAIRLVVNDEVTEMSYGLDLVPLTGGPLRVTVRQHIPKEPERAHLGATVMVRHLAGQVAIDWPATLEAAGAPDPEATSLRIKQLREPIPPGIDDREVNRKRLERGVRVEARLESLEPSIVFGMPTDAYRVTATLLEPTGDRVVELGRLRVPSYALHLFVVGAVLPVAVDPGRPDRITVDWPTAAERAAA